MNRDKLLEKIANIKNSHRAQHNGIKDILREIVLSLPGEGSAKPAESAIEKAKQKLKEAKVELKRDTTKTDEVGS